MSVWLGQDSIPADSVWVFALLSQFLHRGGGGGAGHDGASCSELAPLKGCRM